MRETPRPPRHLPVPRARARTPQPHAAAPLCVERCRERERSARRGLESARDAWRIDSSYRTVVARTSTVSDTDRLSERSSSYRRTRRATTVERRQTSRRARELSCAGLQVVCVAGRGARGKSLVYIIECESLSRVVPVLQRASECRATTRETVVPRGRGARPPAPTVPRTRTRSTRTRRHAHTRAHRFTQQRAELYGLAHHACCMQLRRRPRAAQAHEYHLVWLPPAPAAPPRLSLCSSKGTLVKVSSLSSAAREGRGVGRVAPSERKTLCLHVERPQARRLWRGLPLRPCAAQL